MTSQHMAATPWAKGAFRLRELAGSSGVLPGRSEKAGSLGALRPFCRVAVEGRQRLRGMPLDQPISEDELHAYVDGDIRAGAPPRYGPIPRPSSRRGRAHEVFRAQREAIH